MTSSANNALFTPSWHAELELGYARFGDTTRPVRRRHLGPLRVQKHLYAEGPEICQHIIVHPPGGIAGGDRLDISASVERDAWAQLTSPGAAKWYRANGPAYQSLRLRVGAGATLEWLPQETIVFSAAQAELETLVELEGDARLFYWDMVALGRPASGERFDLWHFQSHLISAAMASRSGTSASASSATTACWTRRSGSTASRSSPPCWSPAKSTATCSNVAATCRRRCAATSASCQVCW